MLISRQRLYAFRIAQIVALYLPGWADLPNALPFFLQLLHHLPGSATDCNTSKVLYTGEGLAYSTWLFCCFYSWCRSGHVHLKLVWE